MPTAARPVVGAAVAVALLGCLLGACSPGPDDDAVGASTSSSATSSPATSSPAISSGPTGGGAVGDPPAGLTAEDVYGRHAKVRGKVDVRLTNDGDADVHVVSYQVRHPMFAEVDPELRDSTVRAGAVVMRPVPFGAPLCDVTDASGAVVRLGLAADDGTVTTVDVPLAEGDPGLVAAHATACAAQAVLDVAAVALGPDWVEVGEDTLRTTLTLQRRSPGTATVATADGSILFSLTPVATGPVVSLADGEDAASVEVDLAVARCDTHALIESKTSFTFPLTAAVGGDDPVPLTVTADDTGRAALQALLARSCNLPT